MATIDPSIAMGYKPVQIENPLNQLAAYSQIQSGQQTQQLNALQMQKAQQELNAQSKLGSAYSRATDRATGKIDYNRLIGSLAEDEATATNIPGVVTARKAEEQAAATLQNTKLDTLAKQREKSREGALSLKRNPSNNNFKAYLEDNVLDGLITQDQADEEWGRISVMDLKQRNEYVKTIALKAENYFSQQETERANAAREKNAAEQLKVSQDQLKVSQGNLDVTRQRLNAEINSTGDFSPASLDLAANLLIQTGQLPNLGMGKNAAALKTRIYNRATELYGNPTGAAPSVNPPGAAPSVNPPGAPNVNAPAGANAPVPFNAAAMADQIVSSKIDVATKTKAAKDFSTGIQGRQVTAFNTAIDHLATMDKLSDALQNNDIKAFNYLGNVIAKQTGQPAPVNFDAAKQIVTAEIIKAVVASGGGVRERQEAEANFSTANSPAQLKGAINTYMQLLGGQLNSLGLQYENTTGRTDFDKKLTGDAKKAFKSVREQHSAGTNASGLPPGVGPDWILKTDAKGNRAYVSPDNSKFVEVK